MITEKDMRAALVVLGERMLVHRERTKKLNDACAVANRERGSNNEREESTIARKAVLAAMRLTNNSRVKMEEAAAVAMSVAVSLAEAARKKRARRARSRTK